jgi:hypothetical protein
VSVRIANLVVGHEAETFETNVEKRLAAGEPVLSVSTIELLSSNRDRRPVELFRRTDQR